MRATAITSCVVIMLGFCQASARTWEVRQDGGGDFAVIQDAVDASATGDTIRIRSGRYLEYSYRSINGYWSANVYVDVTVDSLTFIGDGIDSTIIGPTYFHAEPPYGPIGFLVLQGVSQVRMESLRIDHIYKGTYRWLGHLEINDCAFSECNRGIVSFTDGGMVVRGSVFDGNDDYGILACPECRNAEITGCRFVGNDSHVYFNSSRNGNVTHCTFTNGVVGVEYSQGATGSVTDCQFNGIENIGVAAGLWSSTTIERCSVAGGAAAVLIDGLSHLTGHDNWFDGQTYATVYIENSYLDFEYNQFLNSPAGRTAYIHFFTLQPTDELNMRHNYWGTDNPEEIASMIWDGNDDPNILATIQFEPFLQTTPVSDVPRGSGVEVRALPNPFNPRSTLKYVLPRSEIVTVRAYDVRGRVVRTIACSVAQDAGPHELTWDGRDDRGMELPSGTYVLRLEAGGTERSLRVSLVR